MGKKIIIQSVDYGNIEDNEEALSRLLHDAIYYKFYTDDPTSEFGMAVAHYRELIKKGLGEAEKRIEVWKGLCGKFYHMETFSKRGADLIPVDDSYIFPYLVIAQNETLWLVEVTNNNDYVGGTKDHCKHLDDGWNFETHLTEVTEEEFRQKTQETALNVINTRQRKLREREA